MNIVESWNHQEWSLEASFSSFPLNLGCRGTFELEGAISTNGQIGRNLDLTGFLMAWSICNYIGHCKRPNLPVVWNSVLIAVSSLRTMKVERDDQFRVCRLPNPSCSSGRFPTKSQSTIYGPKGDSCTVLCWVI